MDPDAEQLSIDTPELVSIEMPLAGIGSRFVAMLVDMLLWGAGLTLLALLVWIMQPALQAFSRLSYQWVIALVTLAIFLLNWGYFTIFEAFWNGQTPGKRAVHIRVIEQSGRPIGLLESMARNLVRYIDQVPFFYAVGAVCVFTTRQHQRLGDLAAGTLVVRDRTPEVSPLNTAHKRAFSLQLSPHVPPVAEPPAQLNLSAARLAKLSAADLTVIQSFLMRRMEIPDKTRGDLASRLVSALRAKSELEPPPGISEETFLEAVAHDLRDIARLR